MDLFGSLRIHTVEQVLKTSLVLVIRKVNKLFKFLLETVTQEAVVNSGDPRYIDTDDAEMLHLLS